MQSYSKHDLLLHRFGTAVNPNQSHNNTFHVTRWQNVAGIYVANRAQMDTKVIQTVVDYASKQAAAGTGRLLLAASDAARYCFLHDSKYGRSPSLVYPINTLVL